MRTKSWTAEKILACLMCLICAVMLMYPFLPTARQMVQWTANPHKYSEGRDETLYRYVYSMVRNFVTFKEYNTIPESYMRSEKKSLIVAGLSCLGFILAVVSLAISMVSYMRKMKWFWIFQRICGILTLGGLGSLWFLYRVWGERYESFYYKTISFFYLAIALAVFIVIASIVQGLESKRAAKAAAAEAAAEAAKADATKALAADSTAANADVDKAEAADAMPAGLRAPIDMAAMEEPEAVTTEASDVTDKAEEDAPEKSNEASKNEEKEAGDKSFLSFLQKHRLIVYVAISLLLALLIMTFERHSSKCPVIMSLPPIDRAMWLTWGGNTRLYVEPTWDKAFLSSVQVCWPTFLLFCLARLAVIVPITDLVMDRIRSNSESEA